MRILKVITKEKIRYKQTELGSIPEDWKYIEFEKFVELSKSKFDPSKDKTELKCIELEHLSQETGKLLGYTNSVNQLSIKNRFKSGNILFGKLRPYLKKYLFANFDGVCSSEIWVLQSKEKLCINKYLFYLVQSHDFIQTVNTTSGTKMPRADWNYISEYPFLLPPLSEQEKIAKILSCWDKAIEKKENLIETKTKLKKALMQQLLSGNIRFKDFKYKWQNVSLSKILTPISRKTIKPSKSFLSLGIRSHGKGTFLKNDFEPEKIALEELFMVKENDLIVNITFAWEGAIAIAKKHDDGALVSHRFLTHIINADMLITNYLRYIILTKEFVHNLGLISPGGAGRNRVMSKKDFLNLTISIPYLQEQQKIASVLTNCDNEIELLKKDLEILKNQKKGLMQKLLTGKIRVKID
jgi:type I restriction enzyme S subunit